MEGFMDTDYFKFSNLSEFPELVQGMSTRSFGTMKMLTTDDQVIKNRHHFSKALGIDLARLVKTEGVHGNKIAVVGQDQCGHGVTNDLESVKGVDGLITREPNVFMMITVADCLPLMVYDPILKIAGIAHAGWKGILLGVGEALINEFKAMGSNPEDLVAGIGPGICQRHFIVKNDILDKFKTSYAKSILLRNHDGYVDLKRCLTDQLVKTGVTKFNLEVAKECTVCNNYYFGSYRQEGDKAVYMAAVIGMRG